MTAPKTPSPANPNTAVVPAQPKIPVQPPAVIAGSVALSEAASTFLAEAKGQRESPNRVPLVTINHKDGGFVLPTGEIVQEIAGYPIYYFRTRRYYKKPPQAGAKGSPPDCWSADMVRPHISSIEEQAETCAQCTLAQFGTGRDGRSQACGTHLWLFLYNRDYGNPPLYVVSAPPSSLRAMLGTRFEGGYFSKCTAKYGCYEIAWTTLRLKPEQGQVPFCRLDPIMGPALANVEQVKALAAFRNKFIPAMDEMRMKTAEVTDGEEGGGE